MIKSKRIDSFFKRKVFHKDENEKQLCSTLVQNQRIEENKKQLSMVQSSV